jgi:hypothetical protein
MLWKILRASLIGVRFNDLVVAREGGPVAGGPLPLALGEEVERRREHVGVERGLDLEDLRPVVLEHLAQPPDAGVQRALVAVPHEAAVFSSVSGLWWWLRQRYEARPVVMLFQPPSIAPS